MSAQKGLNLTLKVWRQKNDKDNGQMETYQVSDISTDSSFLEMMDILNEQLINEGETPSLSIMIAVKVSVEVALCTLTEKLMAQVEKSPPVSFT